MQNPILKFRQSFCISKQQVICLKKGKLWRAPTTVEFNIFCSNFAHVSILWMSTKESFGFFLFRSWVIDKPGFCECVKTRYFFILANNSNSKQIKKTPTDPFVDSGK